MVRYVYLGMQWQDDLSFPRNIWTPWCRWSWKKDSKPLLHCCWAKCRKLGSLWGLPGWEWSGTLGFTLERWMKMLLALKEWICLSFGGQMEEWSSFCLGFTEKSMKMDCVCGFFFFLLSPKGFHSLSLLALCGCLHVSIPDVWFNVLQVLDFEESLKKKKREGLIITARRPLFTWALQGLKC